MYVCLCNPFTDKDVQTALARADVIKTTAHIYKHCSGGQSPNCGNCICALKSMVAEHHTDQAVQKLKQQIEPLYAETTIPALCQKTASESVF